MHVTVISVIDPGVHETSNSPANRDSAYYKCAVIYLDRRCRRRCRRRRRQPPSSRRAVAEWCFSFSAAKRLRFSFLLFFCYLLKKQNSPGDPFLHGWYRRTNDNQSASLSVPSPIVFALYYTRPWTERRPASLSGRSVSPGMAPTFDEWRLYPSDNGNNDDNNNGDTVISMTVSS